MFLDLGMENYEYYELLAERIIFSRLGQEEVEKFAKYKPGKTWQDLVDTVRTSRQNSCGRGAEALFDGVAVGLSKLVEIDISEPLYRYEERLKAICESAQA